MKKNDTSFFRSSIERLTRSLYFKRKMVDFGNNSIWVTPSAGLRYLFKPMNKSDPVLFGLVKEFVKKNHVVLDIGANVGICTFSSACCAGSKGLVLSLEPDIWLVQLLRRSLKIQSSESAPVKIIPAAVASNINLREFHIASRSRSANFLKEYGSTQTGETEEEQIVITLTLDWLAERFPLPDILKIDVEGTEIEVLKGRLTLFEKKKPIILCEVELVNSKEIGDILISMGYNIYNGEVPKSKRKKLTPAPWNTIAIPSE